MRNQASGGYNTPKEKPKKRNVMVEYLRGHPRYNTMNGWNRSTSYARNIKLQYIKFPSEECDSRAYDIIGSDDEWWGDCGARGLIEEFAERWRHSYQIGSNGRSGGYLVLYQGSLEPSGYQSHCTKCGQRNYAHVITLTDSAEDKFRKIVLDKQWTIETYFHEPDVKALGLTEERMRQIALSAKAERTQYRNNVTTHNFCGVCRQPTRRNYDKPHMVSKCFPGRGMDEEDDFDDEDNWDLDSLRQRIDLVYDFDETVDSIIASFVEYCESHEVVEQEILVAKTVRVIVPKQ